MRADPALGRHEKTRAVDRLLLPFLRPGDGVLDLGGNVGRYTQRFAEQVGPTGHVLCVEPDPQSLAKARTRTGYFPQVEYLEVACGDTGEARVLYLGQERRSHNSFWLRNVPSHDRDQRILCQTVTLDELAPRVRQLRAIKIDTQGAEVEILRSGIQTLQRHDLVWQIEVWPFGLAHAGARTKDLVSLFAHAGWLPVGTEWPKVIEQARARVKPHTSFDLVVTR